MDPVTAVLAALLGTGVASDVQHAALLHMRGDLDEARTEIASLLGKHPADEAALFTATCFDIERGNLADAERHVAALERSSSTSLHARVLRALIARRQVDPREAIDDALIEAWKRAGRPDLSACPLLPPLDSWSVIPDLDAETRKRLSPTVRLMFAYEWPATSPEFVKLAFEASGAAERNPLAVNVEILGALTPYEPLPNQLATQAQRVAARVAPLVAAADPDNGYLTVAGWLPSGFRDQPLSREDLVLLERAVGSRRFELPRRRMLTELQDLATGFDPRYGVLRARAAALGAPVPLMRLWQRADATKDPGARLRAGAVLIATAERLASSGILLERMLALALAQKGARLSGDESRIADADAEAQRQRAELQIMQDGPKRLGTWPFASPWRDWNPERELEHFRRFLK
jgi:hypothetical protein